MSKWLYALAAFLLFFALTGCGCKGEACHELANKSIYADLQVIEFSHRSKALTAPQYLRGALNSGQYDALGVPAKEGEFPNVWIAVNTNNGSGGILAVPSDEDMSISCDFVDKLISTEKGKVDEVVEGYMRQQCGRN